MYTYTPGAEFRAGIATVATSEAVVAYANGTKTIYTVVTDELTSLAQNDVIRRENDGLTLRITSNAADMTTPAVAQVKFRQVTAERIRLDAEGAAQ